MPLKFLDASRAINPTSPKDIWRDSFQARLDDQFYNSSDWWTIQEETYFSSGVFQDVDVRMNEVISNETGSTPSDDFKILMFKDLSHETSMGWMYYFDDNFWIVINTEKTKTLTTTCTVKRCNNVLRWIDELGGKFTVPFTMGDYLIRENRNYATAGSALVNPSGVIEIVTQFNDNSNRIKANQRFLLGNPNNWTAYKVQGGGINNLNLLKTNDPMSAGILRLTLTVDYVNEDTDDLTNGYADVLQENYLIIVENGYAITANVSGTIQLDSQVQLNGVTVSRNLEYSSNNETVVTVNPSGLVTCVSAGTGTIRVSLENNSDVYKDVVFTVSAVPISAYRISVSPDVNYVLLGETTTFTAQLLLNDVVVPTSFTFTIDPNSVPMEYYQYNAIDGNNYSIRNRKMYLNDTLDITITDGTRTIVRSYQLRGGW